MSENDTNLITTDRPVLEADEREHTDVESSIEKSDEPALREDENGNAREEVASLRSGGIILSDDEVDPVEHDKTGDNELHADAESAIQESDEATLREDQKGNVKEEIASLRSGGIILSNDEIDPVEEEDAHKPDGAALSEEEWGYVDGEGNIHQKDSVHFKGRIIGKTTNKNKAASLAYFAVRFKEMEDRYNQLMHSVRTTTNKPQFLGKVQYMLGYVPVTDALGDFDGLIDGLKNLEQEILEHQNDNRQRKEKLAEQAESLTTSTSWRKTADQLKKLQAQWKKIRSAGKEYDDTLWQRFRGAQDMFFQRRTEHFDLEARRMEENMRRKEQLCLTAESLIDSTDRNVMEQVKALQADWKTIGRVPREYNDAIWSRFIQACNQAYKNARKEQKRIAAERAKRRHEIAESVSNKQYLCSMAESLVNTSDTEEIRDLQARWKTAGYVPPKEGDALWERFRLACNRVFQNAREEREEKQFQWRQRTQDALERKRDQARRLRESIVRDSVNIERWKDAIKHLQDGKPSDEIRTDTESRISEVEKKIKTKEKRLGGLEKDIRDIEKKLKKRSPSSKKKTEQNTPDTPESENQ